MKRMVLFFLVIFGAGWVSPRPCLAGVSDVWKNLKRKVNKLTGDMAKDLEGFYYFHNDGITEFLRLEGNKTFHYYNTVAEKDNPDSYNEKGNWELDGETIKLKSALSNRVERQFKVAVENDGVRLERAPKDSPLLITYIGEMSPKSEKFVRYLRVEDEAEALKDIELRKTREDEKTKKKAERDEARRKKEEEKRKREEEREAKKRERESVRQKRSGKKAAPENKPAMAVEVPSEAPGGATPAPNPKPEGEEPAARRPKVSGPAGIIDSGGTVTPSEVPIPTTPKDDLAEFQASRADPAFFQKAKLPVSPGFLGHYIFQDTNRTRFQLRFVEGDKFFYIEPGGKILNGTYRMDNSILSLEADGIKRRFRYMKEGYKLILYRVTGDRVAGGVGGSDLGYLAPKGNDPVVYKKVR